MEQDIIESENYVEYRPPVSIDINQFGQKIPIQLYNEDIKTLPHKSSLVISGRVIVKKTSDSSILGTIDLKKVNFVNNGILHLFSRISYNMGGNEIDSIDNPGVAVAMKGLVSFNDDINFNNAGWKIKSKYDIISKEGYFSVVIPLKILMGFFEDYEDYVYRIHQELILIKTNANYNNVLLVDSSITADHTVTINLSDIIWRIPQYKFSIAYETRINKEIASDIEYEMFYRHWMYIEKASVTGKSYAWDIPTSYYKPRYVLIGFQKVRNDKINSDNGLFDLCNLENVQVHLNNNVIYPNNRLNVLLSENKCNQIYEMFKDFKYSYYGKEGKSLIDYNDFITKYPIIVIDCSKQSEIIKGSTINIKINFQWWEAFVPESIIHCLVITSDRARYNPLRNSVIVH